MDNSDIPVLIILVVVILPIVLLWIISSKLQVVIDILRKMEMTKIKFFDETHSK